MSVEGKHTPLPDRELLHEALRFLVWGAGQGLAPPDAEALDPEGTLWQYTQRTGDGNWETVADRYKASAVNSYYELLEALRGMVDTYVELGNSGDAGFWDPEQVSEVIAARAAISKATMGEGGEGR